MIKNSWRPPTGLVTVSIIALLALTGCGDPQAEANKRVVEASQLMASLTSDAPLEARLTTLERAEGLIASIPNDLSGTTVAVDIMAGKPVGGVSLVALRDQLSVTREAIKIRQCETVPTEGCLVTLFQELKAKVPKDNEEDLESLDCQWLLYASRRQLKEEIQKTSSKLSRGKVIECAPEVLGGNVADLVPEIIENKLSIFGALDAAHTAGDKAVLASILSRPEILTIVNDHIVMYDLPSLNLSTETKAKLAEKFQSSLETPSYNARVLNKGDADSFVGSMDSLDIPRGETIKVINRIGDRLAAAYPSPKAMKIEDRRAYMDEASSIAKLYERVGEIDKRTKLVSEILETASIEPNDYNISFILISIGEFMSDSQVKSFSSHFQKNQAREHLALLGLILKKAGRGDIGEALLSTNKEFLNDDAAAVVLYEPKNLTLLRELAPNADWHLKARSALERVKVVDKEVAESGISELLKLGRENKNPATGAMYIGDALLILSYPLRGKAVP